MTEYSPGNGETLEVADGNPDDEFTVEVLSGSAGVGKTPIAARLGRTGTEGRAAKVTLKEPGEKVFVHGEEAGTTVRVHNEGFILDWFSSDPQTTRPTDIASQSAGNLGTSQNRRNAEGVTEVSADQTSNVGPGESETGTFTAGAGEIWIVRGLFLNAPPTGAGSEGAVHSFTVQSEREGVKFAFGEDGEVTKLRYGSGEWHQNSSDMTGRSDVDGTRFDDTNGLQVVYALGGGANSTQTSNRTIRLQVESVKV